jgi:hypothetical protein
MTEDGTISGRYLVFDFEPYFPGGGMWDIKLNTHNWSYVECAVDYFDKAKVFDRLSGKFWAGGGGVDDLRAFMGMRSGIPAPSFEPLTAERYFADIPVVDDD